VATSYSSTPQRSSATWKSWSVWPRREPLKPWDEHLDDEAAARVEVSRDVPEAGDLRLLRGQVHDRVAHEIGDGEGPVDARRREVSDRDADAFCSGLRAQPRHHRARQLDPVHRHAALYERKRQAPGADAELERAAAAGNLGEEVDGGVDDVGVEQSFRGDRLVVGRGDALVEVPVGPNWSLHVIAPRVGFA
jgi:hypothetical protein